MNGKRNIPSNSAPKIRHIGGKTDRHWCWYLILFLMSEIMNGWRNICSTFAPKLSCIGGKTIMVGAGIKSSFGCKQIQSGKINICSTLAPKLSLIGGKPDHDWCINEILFPMSKMLHGKRNIRLTLAPNTIVYNLPFLILPMWNSRSGTSLIFFFFFWPCQKLGVRFIHRYLQYCWCWILDLHVTILAPTFWTDPSVSKLVYCTSGRCTCIVYEK